MKTTVESLVNSIKTAVEDLQGHSFTEFQQILPSRINNSWHLGYSFLDHYFSGETGITIKEYFNQVKLEKANELFEFYRLSPIEVAYQLGFKTPASLKKSISIRNRYLQTRIPYHHFHRRLTNTPEFIR